jgi:tetratricopeptide (TPR) repeat protein
MPKKGFKAIEAAEDYRSQGLLDDAAAAYREAASFFKEEQDFDGQADALTSLGKMYEQLLSDYHHALENYQQSLRIRQIYGLQQLSQEYFNVAEQQNYLGRMEEAKDNLERARHAAKREGDQRILGKSMILLGEILVEEGYLDEAEENLRTCLELVTGSGDDLLIARVQGSIGLLLVCRSKHDQAINACQSALAHAVKTGDPEIIASTHLRFGQTLWMAGDHGAAREHLQKAQDIAQQTKVRILRETASDWLDRCRQPKQ